MRESNIELNAFAEAIFEHDRFVPGDVPVEYETVELTVHDLGFESGATMPEIIAAGARLGLAPCPLELAVYLRLAMPDQAEGHWGQPETRHTAPPGAITVISPPLAEDDTVPKGFYLRKIKGVLWLRGYVSDATHVLRPGNHLIFCKS
ncbi:MAG: hypothetical protein SF172_16295 [Burkholderiales bacterium]|nr:hypothetical protein [Burkholderiales bacterium]